MFVNSTKHSVSNKDTANMKVTDSKPADVMAAQKEAEKTLTDSVSVEEYRVKLAEKRRLAREKAELEAEQQEEMRRQWQ